MPEIKLPTSPFGTSCERCKWWLKSEANNMIMLPGGDVRPIADFIKQGNKVDPNWVTSRMAPCALQPIWALVAKQHWCAGFSPRFETVEDTGNPIVGRGNDGLA